MPGPARTAPPATQPRPRLQGPPPATGTAHTPPRAPRRSPASDGKKGGGRGASAHGAGRPSRQHLPFPPPRLTVRPTPQRRLAAAIADRWPRAGGGGKGALRPRRGARERDAASHLQRMRSSGGWVFWAPGEPASSAGDALGAPARGCRWHRRSRGGLARGRCRPWAGAGGCFRHGGDRDRWLPALSRPEGALIL